MATLMCVRRRPNKCAFFLLLTIVCLAATFYAIFHTTIASLLSTDDVTAEIELVLNEQLHNARQGRRTSAATGSNNQQSVALFLAVKRAEDLQTEYRLAHRTVKCYCAMKNYPLIVADLSSNATLQKLCPQKDFMFQRHCALSHWLADHPSVKWALFMDADMAIINPNHLMEDHIHSTAAADADLVFYERIFNGEIAAGSYLARNTEFTRNFLQYWANYYAELPWSWHGTDNGAIHAVFMDYFCGKKDELQCSKRRSTCWHFWHASANDDGLRLFTDCVRSVLGVRNRFSTGNGTVQLLTNFRMYWSRDGWLTGSKWCSRDFFLHGWKKKWQNASTWGGWKSPMHLGEEQLDALLTVSKCASASFTNTWPYDSAYKASIGEIDTLLAGHLHEMRMTQLDYWRRVEEAEQREEKEQ